MTVDVNNDGAPSGSHRAGAQGEIVTVDVNNDAGAPDLAPDLRR